MTTNPLTSRQIAARKAVETRNKNLRERRQADLNAEADRVYKTLSLRTRLSCASDRRYWYWPDGSRVDAAVVSLLIRQKRARIGDNEKNGRQLFKSSPAEYAAEERQRSESAKARKRQRLDRWAVMISSVVENTDEHTLNVRPLRLNLDDVLEKIANEAMSLGSLED